MQRAAKWLAFAVLFSIAVLALGVVIPLPFGTGSHGSKSAMSAADSHRVLLLAGSIHTDIALPANGAVLEAFSFLADDGLDTSMGGVDYIVIGWGGREFYVNTPAWSDLKPWPVVRALTIDESVMHISLSGAIDASNPTVKPIHLSDGEFRQLIDAAKNSFARSPTGRPIVLEGKNYHRFERFYEAKGSFNVLVGCNIWTARMLRIAGSRTGVWTPLPWLLHQSLEMQNPSWRFRPANHKSSVDETLSNLPE